MAGDWEDNPDRGADVARSPLTGRENLLTLNATDPDRAAIIRRYRLFSYQPDEMITLRALAGMRPSEFRFDPRMYQYGGLWIYPVGALLKAAAWTGYVTLRPGVSWYLDHPESFGRMYVIARLYSAFWGILGVVAVFAIVRRIAGGWLVPAAAGLCFACMPVIVNGAHEAKPHLAGLVLMLFAVLAAGRYVETGKRSKSLLAGAWCGAAIGMVPTAYPIFSILVLMALLRRQVSKVEFQGNGFARTLLQSTGGKGGDSADGRSISPLRMMIASGGLGVLTYLLANPYLPVNLFFNRKVVQSNLGNSAEMYHAGVSGSGLANAASLIFAGTSSLLALAGATAAIALAIRAVRIRSDRSAHEVRRRALGLLLAVTAAFVAIQFCLLATGKPGEYGRFAMLPDTFLAIEAFVAAGTFIKNRVSKGAVIALLVIFTAIQGGFYLRGFIRDSRESTSRLQLAAVLRKANEAGMRTLTIGSEPAPYCLPPVNLFDWQIRLAPRGFPAARIGELGDMAVLPTDAPALWTSEWLSSTPISWADKHYKLDKSTFTQR